MSTTWETAESLQESQLLTMEMRNVRSTTAAGRKAFLGEDWSPWRATACTEALSQPSCEVTGYQLINIMAD